MASSNGGVAPTRPASTHSSTSSHSTKTPLVPERSHSSMSLPKGATRREPPPIPSVIPEGDWETREEVKSKELEEARARAAQMEKTMRHKAKERWWSDCTANWREKWSKVRNERNKSREECRHLRAKLESYAKETSLQKKGKEELSVELELLRNKVVMYESQEKVQISSSSSGTYNKPERDRKQTKTGLCKGSESENFVSELLARKEKDLEAGSNKDSDKITNKETAEVSIVSDPLLDQKLLAVTMKLEEAQKTIHMERGEKTVLLSQVDELKTEMTSVVVQQEELKKSRDEVKFKLEQLQHEHQSEIGRVTEDLEDEYISRSDLNTQLIELRKELEKIQAENALEWGKRERLESEKLSLERENKKLRIEVENLEEDLQRKSQQATVLLDGDLKTLQFEFAEKNKELTDIKHSTMKLKKAYTDKCAELDHAKSRAEQYEMEVKKLRLRVDELKHDLAGGEDEVDQQANQIRRLQRTNDELQVQCENLQVQVEHLQTRLRSSNTNILPQRGSSHKGFDEDEAVDTPTTDDDNED